MPASPALHLNLWKQQLGEVPDSVWQQTEIETLVLADNGLTQVSEEISRLTKLRMLDLGHNQLSQVPPRSATFPASPTFSTFTTIA
ncbi:hypothetical protein RBB78_17200 [Tunturiibacter empetritectus]|uniref:leucine-rich repeat domain-containing protein n=1 Tax=Tunturiibacter empetritectus TaxID=3069691 RepID=UPI003D9B3C23